MAGTKLTKTAVRMGIVGSGGVKLRVCEALKISRQTLDNYLKRWPELADDLVTEGEQMVDEAENAIRDLVAERHPPSVMFVLQTKGKGRGWTARTELTGADGAGLFDLSPAARAAMQRLGVTADEIRAQFEALILASASDLGAGEMHTGEMHTGEMPTDGDNA